VKATASKAPQQKEGSESNITYSRTTASEKECRNLYEKARKNLLDINRWQQIAGKLSADFHLTDPYGNPVERLPLQGDYIKIHLPTSSDDKFDWVRIEAIEEKNVSADHQYILIRVRPSDAPRHKEDTEHFFSKDATSSFSIERAGLKIEAAVRGRNELPNIQEQDGLMKKLRNLVVGLTAMFGGNYPQWKGLVRGMLRK